MFLGCAPELNEEQWNGKKKCGNKRRSVSR
jgi:hypothetical protein